MKKKYSDKPDIVLISLIFTFLEMSIVQPSPVTQKIC